MYSAAVFCTVGVPRSENLLIASMMGENLFAKYDFVAEQMIRVSVFLISLALISEEASFVMNSSFCVVDGGTRNKPAESGIFLPSISVSASTNLAILAVNMCSFADLLVVTLV